MLARDEEFVTAVTVDELLPRPGGVGDGESGDGGSGVRSSEDGASSGGRVGEPVLDHLDETMFTSYSRADMVAASREIEDRAWRVGNGELHAGFQTLDVLTGEADTYDLLGEKERLDVHAYAADEGNAPDVEHYTVHVGETPKFGKRGLSRTTAAGTTTRSARCSPRNARRASSTDSGATTPRRSITSSTT